MTSERPVTEDAQAAHDHASSCPNHRKSEAFSSSVAPVAGSHRSASVRSRSVEPSLHRHDVPDEPP
jgi:hypothetical protein